LIAAPTTGRGGGLSPKGKERKRGGGEKNRAEVFLTRLESERSAQQGIPGKKRRREVLNSKRKRESRGEKDSALPGRGTSGCTLRKEKGNKKNYPIRRGGGGGEVILFLALRKMEMKN